MSSQGKPKSGKSSQGSASKQHADDVDDSDEDFGDNVEAMETPWAGTKTPMTPIVDALVLNWQSTHVPVVSCSNAGRGRGTTTPQGPGIGRSSLVLTGTHCASERSSGRSSSVARGGCGVGHSCGHSSSQQGDSEASFLAQPLQENL